MQALVGAMRCSVDVDIDIYRHHTCLSFVTKSGTVANPYGVSGVLRQVSAWHVFGQEQFSKATSLKTLEAAH